MTPEQEKAIQNAKAALVTALKSGVDPDALMDILIRTGIDEVRQFGRADSQFQSTDDK